MRDPTSLPQDLRRAMVGIKQVQIDGNRVWEVKFADKQSGLDFFSGMPDPQEQAFETAQPTLVARLGC